MQHHRSPTGIISLLALIIMATVTATAVGSSVLIIRELQQTENLDQSVSAVYAAEAGIEEGLFIVKISRQSRLLSDTKILLNCPTGTGGCLPPARQALPNGARWSRTANTEEQFHVSRLGPDQTATMDLFDPDSLTGASGVNSLKIEWGDGCGGFAQIEITMISWEVSSIGFDSATQRVFKETHPCNAPSLTSERCETLVRNSIGTIGNTDIDSNKVHRFIFRTLTPESGIASTCNIEKLVVTTYTDPSANPGTEQPLPARLTLKSTGEFSRSRQALTASIPWRAPVSGLLNFVLFSEEEIDK